MKSREQRWFGINGSAISAPVLIARLRPPRRRICSRRSAYVKSGETFGGWEGDSMIFERSQGRMNVASRVERKTRFAVLFRHNDRSSTQSSNKLMDVMEPLPRPARKAITFDRDFEFRAWRELESGSESWFRDPQAPWQKRSVEKLNKRAPIPAP